VYAPEALMVPTVPFPPSIPPALQLTAVLVVPVTVAVNWTDPPGATVAPGGDIETVTLLGGGGGGLLVLEPLPPPPQAAVKAAIKMQNILARDALRNIESAGRDARFKSFSNENFASRI
jgi:hypothetical protein